MKYVLVKKSRAYNGGPGMASDAYREKGNFTPRVFDTLEEAQADLEVLKKVGSNMGYDIHEYKATAKDLKIPVGYIHGTYLYIDPETNELRTALAGPAPEGWVKLEGQDITDDPSMEGLKEVLRKAGATGRIVLPRIPGCIIKK
jgi:hypothetical protein